MSAKIPDSWVWASLTDLYYLPTGVEEYTNLKSYYSTGSIQKDGNIPEGDFNFKNRPSRANRIVKKGDIVQARMKETNKALYIGDELSGSLFSTGFFQLRPNQENIDSRYLLHYFTSPTFLSDKDENCTGATQQALNDDNAQKIAIPLPPFNEQKQIAKKLDTLLSQVNIIQKRLDNIPNIIKQFRQSVLIAATSGKLTEEWRKEIDFELESVAFEKIEMFNDKELDELPSVWIWTEFKNAADIKSNLQDPLQFPDDYHIAPNHIESGTGRLLEYQTVLEDNVKSAKHRFYPGQILYSKIRPYLNKVCLVDFTGLCSADMYPINSLIESKYLYYWMLSNRFVEWTSTKQGRVVLPKINQKALNTIPVPIPPTEEQKEIVSRVESLLSVADALEAKIEAARKKVDNFIKSIFNKAFQGELVEQDPNDEPAKKLLERIKAEQEKGKLKKKVSPKKNNKSYKVSPDCSTVEKLFAFLIKEFDKQEFTIEDVYSSIQCDKQKLIKFIFQLVKEQKFKINEDTYEIYNLWKDDKQVLKINKVTK